MEVGVRWDDSGGDGGQVTGSSETQTIAWVPAVRQATCKEVLAAQGWTEGVWVQDVEVIEAAGH